MKRFTYFLISITLAAHLARPLHAQAPATTTISNVVYRGDGTPAGGTLLISWPAFETSDGKAVAAGSKSVALGAGGTLTVSLVPNENAVPAGTFYRVVYKLDDGSTSQELWSVPALSPTTIAAVRSTIVPSGVAMQVASRQYVDSSIAAIAGTSTRFHGIRLCDGFSGSNAGAKIAACIADLPATGGIADARGLEGAQTISSDPFTGVTKPVTLLLGAATFSVTANVTAPANVTLNFSRGGSFSVATGVTLAIGGPFAAAPVRVFTLNGTGAITFSSNRQVTQLYPQWWGAAGDGSTDDAAAIQAAINALPTVSANLGAGSATSPSACVFFPQVSSFYRITAPLSISSDGVCLLGANYTVTIKNAEANEATLSIDSSTNRALSGIVVRSLSLLGTGASSKAVYANAILHGVFDYFSIDSGGYAFYCESTHPVLTGCDFNSIRVHGQPPGGAGSGVTVIYSSGGRSNIFEVRARQAEYGIDLVDEIGSVIRNSYIESNNQGTAQTGIRVRRSNSYPVSGGGNVSNPVYIENTYFENNPKFTIDAEAGTFVSLKNVRGSGGINADASAAAQIRLNGGGVIEDSWFGATLLTSSSGVIRARNTFGVYGKASQVQIAGMTFPLPPGGANTATQSWFDSDPTWTNLGSGNTPALFYDSTQKFYGEGSKKAVFPSGASTFGDSRTRLDQTITPVTQNDLLNVFVAARFGTAGKGLGFLLRNNGGASETIHDFLFSTDTGDWMVFALQGRVPAGVSSAALFLSGILGTPLGAALDTWTGAVAIARNAPPVLINTDWAARGAYDVDLQAGRFRTGVFTPPSGTAPFTVPSNAAKVSNLDADKLDGADWAVPPAIGSATPNTGAFSSLSASGQISSTVAPGTAPFSIASTTPVSNLTLAADTQLPLVGLAKGGTGQSSWTAARCVRVNDGGTALEPASADCGLGGGGGDNLSVNALAASDANLKDGSISANDVPVKFALDTAPAPDDITAKVTTTDIRSVTFGNAAGFTWTFDAGITDPTLAFASGSVSLGSADLLFASDNARDIGAAAASRPKDYFGAGRFRVGPAISLFAAGGQAFLNDSHNYAAVLNAAAADSTALAAVNEDNTTNPMYALGAFADSEHTSGNRAVAAALTFDVKHGGAGTITDLMGITNSMTIASGAGNTTRATVYHSGGITWNSANTLTDAFGVRVASNTKSAGNITTNYGIKIENQTAGTSNYSLFTGTGRVRFGDDVDFASDNTEDIGTSGANRPRTGYFGTSVVAPTLNAATVLQTNGATRLDSAGNLNSVSLDAEGAGNTVSYPAKFWLSTAGCNSATAAPSFDLPASSAPSASCYGTSPHRFGALDFADGSALTATLHLQLPSDWTSAGGVDIKFIWFSGSTSTNSAVWTVRTACVADGEDLLNPTYNAEQTVSDANNATANQRNSASITGVTATGCVAGETMYFRIGRDPANASDTLAGTATLLGVEVTARRAM